MHKITAVEKKSPAARTGIVTGEELLKINGVQVTDVLDYLYLTADECPVLTIKGLDDKIRDVGIKNPRYAPLGLQFEHPTLSKPISCRNKCVFCFIDQLPKGMRASLYFKDDDYRLCFLYGNYVTLTNADQAALERIVKMRLSPVNISVHTTNSDLRVKMLGNRYAGELEGKMVYLAQNDIQMQAQIVLCPGLNDGAELKRTLRDLTAYYPQLSSVSVVDVGLTRYRQGLCEILPVDKAVASETLAIVEEFQREMLAAHKARWVFCGDELYIKAGAAIPAEDFYEDFAQYENGVGFIAALRTEFLSALKSGMSGKKRTLSIACGTSVAPYLRELIARAHEKYGTNCVVYAVENRFFGPAVTASGLLTGLDLIDALKDKPLGDKLLLSSIMLKSGEDILLDDISVKQIEKELNIPVAICPQDGAALLRVLIE